MIRRQRRHGGIRAVAVAGWLLAAGVFFHCPVAGAEVQVSDEARELFRTGVKHLKASPPDHQAAFDAFRAAYADSPSPKILGNLGLAAAKLERDGEAIEAYERYLKEAGAKSLSERRAIDADLKKLRARVSRLRLTGLPAGATLRDRRVDGNTAIENAYVPDGSSITLGLRAGRHEITVEAEGYAPKTLTVELSPGDEDAQGVRMTALDTDDPDAEPVDPDPPPIDEGTEASDGVDAGAIGMWAAIGTTAALGIATGVVSGLAASNFSSFEEARDAGDQARADELRDEGETLNLTADVLLGVTGAAAVTSLILVVLEVTGDDASDDEADVAVRVRPVVTPQGGFIGLEGSF